MSSTNVSLDKHKRQFLSRLGATIGIVAAANLITTSTMSVALAYQTNDKGSQRVGQVFSKMQMQMLEHICEVVLPKTDTPSAADVDCHGFIDNQLAHCYSVKHQQQCKQIIDRINAKSREHFTIDFVQLTTEQQTTVLTEFDSQNNNEKQRNQFKFLKHLIVFGFFTSQVGATKALNYQAVPGGYKGSIKVSTDDKAWGSLSRYY